MRKNWLSIIFLISLTTLNPSNLLFAQDSATFNGEETYITPSLSQFRLGLKSVFTDKANLFYLTTGTAVSLLVWPHDDDISANLKEDDFNEFEVQAPTQLGKLYVLAGSSLMTYAVGHLIHKPHLANTGIYMIEALTTTEFITLFTKLSAQRTRPDKSNNLSFPSGHTSGVFTIASVLDKRYGYKVGIPSYLVAGFVGLSRVKTQRHFPTDVIAGAALGVIIGRSFAPSGNTNTGVVVAPAFSNDYSGLLVQMRF